MTKPVRIQLRRTARWSLQEVSLAINGLPAINCARPGPLGNPFRIADSHLPEPAARKWAIERHIAWLERGTIPASMRVQRFHLLDLRRSVLAKIPELRGHNLACHCGIDEACHTDYYLLAANK